VNEVSASFRRDRHAADGEWLDYARHLGDGARRSELASHLETGCARCAKTLGLWLSAASVAGRDASYAPPDALIRQMRGEFALQRPDLSDALTASLVFDSFLQALPGVRSASTGPRQLLYRAGRYVIRLRAEDEPESGRVSLVGQVVDEEHPGAFLPDLTVMVFDGKQSIERTLTNNLGEFAFDGAPAGSLRLAIGVAQRGFLTVALPVARTDRGEEPPARAKRMD
jgi:hypothetical protein